MQNLHDKPGNIPDPNIFAVHMKMTYGRLLSAHAAKKRELNLCKQELKRQTKRKEQKSGATRILSRSASTSGLGMGGSSCSGHEYQSEKSPLPISETEDARICEAVFEYTNRLVLLEGQETKLRPKLQAICHAVSHFQLPPVILELQGFPRLDSTTVCIFCLLASQS